MALQSKSFGGDSRLEAAAVSDPAHILRGASGEHVSKVQRALMQLFDEANIERAELSDAKYGETTEKTVKAYKSRKGKEVINHTYQQSPDSIVGKMTMAKIDGELVEKEKDDPDYFFFKDDQKALVKDDIARAKVMVANVVARLRLVGGIGKDGGLVIMPRNYLYYETKLKILNVFHINSFREDDLPAPADVVQRLTREFSGFKGLPEQAGDISDQLGFSILLENYANLQASLDRPFRREFYTMGTFRGSPLSFFAAFVDARNPKDETVRFTRHYFDEQIMPTQDDRAVTVAHERCHTIFRANGHPGTGDNPFCVTPHLGDPNVTSSEEALMNPYCYEWFIVAMQPAYLPRQNRNNGCGT